MASNRVVAVRLRAEMAQFKKEWSDAGKAVSDAAGNMDAAAKKAAATKVQLDGAGTSVGRMGVRLRENRAEWDQAGTSMVRTGAVLVGVGALVTKAAMDWESSWTGVLKTVDGTPAQLGKVENGLRGLAKELPASHAEIAAVAEAAGQLGIETPNVVAFTRTMIDLGETTNLSAEEAATSLARFSNIMGTNQKDVGRLGASIVGLGNNFATTESEILQLATRLAGAGVQAKLSEGDVFGIATAMSSVGVEAEAGGSAMSLTMKRIGKEVESGGSKLGQFAEVAGMSSGDFAKAWEDDAGGALAAFVEGLGRTEASGKSTNAVLSELGVTGLRESDALLRLSSATGVLTDAMSQGNAEYEANSALVEEAAKRYDTADAKVSIAWNNIKDSAIDAGQAMLPVVEQIANAVNFITDAFSGLPGPIKGAVGPISVFAGVALLAVGGAMKLAGSIMDMRTNMGALQIDAPKSAKALGFLAKALGLVAAAAAAGSALENWDKGKFDVAGVNEFTRGLLDAAGGSDALINSLSSSDSTGLSIGGWGSNEIKGLGDAFDAVTDSKGKMDLSFASDSAGERAARVFEQIDSALSSAVQSGDMERAGEMMKVLKDQTGASSKELGQFLPSYKDAMAGVDLAQREAGDSAGTMAGQMESAAASVGMSSEELMAAQEAAQSTAEAFIGLGASLNDSTVSLGDWLGELEAQNEALASFTANSIKAAREGLDEGLIASLQAAGPEGAMRLGELADASESEIARANSAWRGGQDEIQTYISAMTGIPLDVISEFSTPGAADAVDTAVDLAQKYEGLDSTTVESILRALDYSSEDIAAVKSRLRDLDNTNANPTVRVDTASSFDVLRGLRAEINGITGKTVIVKVARQGGTPGGITANADGGFYSGPTKVRAAGGMDEYGRGVPRVPQMRSGSKGTVQWAEPETGWEAYISGKSGMEARNRLILSDAAMRLGMQVAPIGGITAFAAGGQIDALDPADYTRMKIKVRDLKRSISEREKYGKNDTKSRYVLRGLDRTEAYQELRYAEKDLAAQAKVQRKVPNGISARTYNARMERAEVASSAGESYSSNADIQSFTSPASVNRALGQAINDMATYTQLLISLKKKGAAPWLLDQLQKAGPSRGSISLARKYLSDTSALKAVNAQAAQLSAVSNIYGQVTTDARWDASKAWSGSLSSAQQRTINEGAKTVNLTLNPIPGMSDTQVANMAGSSIMQAFR